LKWLPLQLAALSALRQFAGVKINLEDTKAQTPERVFSLHGNLNGIASRLNHCSYLRGDASGG
jgi:hypothetical protein